MIVLAHGTWDLLHPGHVRFLTWCRNQGELVVGVTTDRFVRKRKGDGRPVFTHNERAELLFALDLGGHIVHVVDAKTAIPLIERYSPCIYVKGHDYAHRTSGNFMREKRLVERLGGRVMFAPPELRMPGSSEIIRRIRSAQD